MLLRFCPSRDLRAVREILSYLIEPVNSQFCRRLRVCLCNSFSFNDLFHAPWRRLHLNFSREPWIPKLLRSQNRHWATTTPPPRIFSPPKWQHKCAASVLFKSTLLLTRTRLTQTQTSFPFLA